MRLILIRHAATQGNLERRYVGSTDEGLSGDGRRALLARRDWPVVGRVAASPMRRCLETAALVYPGHRPIVVPDFREIDFGDFEYKTADELSANPGYQAWIDSGGELPFPGGESRQAFDRRCIAAFERLMCERAPDADALAIVAHGGTFMSILSRFALPARPYFDWRLPNGEPFECEWDGRHIETETARRPQPD